MSKAPRTPPTSLTWLEHKGQRVLQVDMRSLDRDGLLAAAEGYGRLLRGEPDGSVRLLVLVGAAEFHPDAFTRGRGVMIEVSSKIRCSAVVGPEGLMRQAVERFFDTATLLGHDLSRRGRGYPEGDEAMALDWLVKA